MHIYFTTVLYNENYADTTLLYKLIEQDYLLFGDRIEVHIFTNNFEQLYMHTYIHELWKLIPGLDRSWIDLSSLWESVHTRLIRSILDRSHSQFAFERSHSHSDPFGLRSISDRSNSLVWRFQWVYSRTLRNLLMSIVNYRRLAWIKYQTVNPFHTKG